MASVAKVLAELKGTTSVIAANAGFGEDELKQSLSSSMCSLIRQISHPVMSDQATMLLDATRASMFSDTQKASII
eukprot:1702576-Pyramimonas_sp.AAC.1